MKKMFIIMSVLVFTSNVYAQRSVHFQPVNSKYVRERAFVMQLLKNSGPRAAAKTTLDKERLILSSYDNSGGFRWLNDYDSAKYKYSGNRGSVYDLNQMRYDFPATQFDYQRPIFDVMIYGVAGPEVKCDTAIYRNADSVGVFHLANTTIAGYDANDALLSYTSVNIDTSSTPSVAYYNTYNGSGKVTANICFTTPNGTTWDTAAKRYFSYNGAGQLTIDSIFTKNGSTWFVGTRYEYTYDGSGNLAQIKTFERNTAVSPAINTGIANQTYYGSGQLKTVYIYNDTGTGLYLDYADTFGYAAGHNYFNFNKTLGYLPTGGWGELSSFTKHINTAGVPDTGYKKDLISIYSGDTLIAVLNFYFKEIVIYNAHNDPDEQVELMDLGFGGGYTENFDELFYYEPATAIAHTPVAYKMEVYPNPTTDGLNILPDNALKNKQLQLQLTNTEGKLLRSLQMRYMGGAVQMPLTGLNSGIYYLTIADGSGNVSAREKIVKQ